MMSKSRGRVRLTGRAIATTDEYVVGRRDQYMDCTVGISGLEEHCVRIRISKAAVVSTYLDIDIKRALG